MITVTTQNFKEIDANGTHLQGNVEVEYKTLVEIFGEPELFDGDGDKVDAEWVLEFTDLDSGESTIATIYNYKDGKSYCGAEGLEVEDITDWHIGGKSEKAAELVKRFIDGL